MRTEKFRIETYVCKPLLVAVIRDILFVGKCGTDVAHMGIRVVVHQLHEPSGRDR